MTLYQKINLLYPELQLSDFDPITGTIFLQNDGEGDYIKEWKHPTFQRPTDKQLA